MTKTQLHKDHGVTYSFIEDFYKPAVDVYQDNIVSEVGDHHILACFDKDAKAFGAQNPFRIFNGDSDYTKYSKKDGKHNLSKNDGTQKKFLILGFSLKDEHGFEEAGRHLYQQLKANKIQNIVIPNDFTNGPLAQPLNPSGQFPQLFLKGFLEEARDDGTNRDTDIEVVFADTRFTRELFQNVSQGLNGVDSPPLSSVDNDSILPEEDDVPTLPEVDYPDDDGGELIDKNDEQQIANVLVKTLKKQYDGYVRQHEESEEHNRVLDAISQISNDRPLVISADHSGVVRTSSGRLVEHIKKIKHVHELPTVSNTTIFALGNSGNSKGGHWKYKRLEFGNNGILKDSNVYKDSSAQGMACSSYCVMNLCNDAQRNSEDFRKKLQANMNHIFSYQDEDGDFFNADEKKILENAIFGPEGEVNKITDSKLVKKFLASAAAAGAMRANSNKIDEIIADVLTRDNQVAYEAMNYAMDFLGFQTINATEIINFGVQSFSDWANATFLGSDNGEARRNELASIFREKPELAEKVREMMRGKNPILMRKIEDCENATLKADTIPFDDESSVGDKEDGAKPTTGDDKKDETAKSSAKKENVKKLPTVQDFRRVAMGIVSQKKEENNRKRKVIVGYDIDDSDSSVIIKYEDEGTKKIKIEDGDKIFSITDGKIEYDKDKLREFYNNDKPGTKISVVDVTALIIAKSLENDKPAR